MSRVTIDDALMIYSWWRWLYVYMYRALERLLQRTRCICTNERWMTLNVLLSGWLDLGDASSRTSCCCCCWCWCFVTRTRRHRTSVSQSVPSRIPSLAAVTLRIIIIIISSSIPDTPTLDAPLAWRAQLTCVFRSSSRWRSFRNLLSAKNRDCASTQH